MIGMPLGFDQPDNLGRNSIDIYLGSEPVPSYVVETCLKTCCAIVLNLALNMAKFRAQNSKCLLNCPPGLPRRQGRRGGSLAVGRRQPDREDHQNGDRVTKVSAAVVIIYSVFKSFEDNAA